MVQMLGIQDGDRVLEVGGGFYQFERADVITDLTFSDTSNRNGAPILFRKGKKYVECAIEDLPFKEKEFDFVFCSHVMEHCVDPEKAAAELSRVSRRGYVEMPRLFSEFVLGNPSHRWMVTQVGKKLNFEPRPFVESPFRNFMHAHVLNDASFDTLGRENFHNIFNIQLVFEDRLEAEITRQPGPLDFDYADRVQAGISHLLFAYNNLYFKANCEYALSDAIEATDKLPNDPEAWHVLGLFQLRLLMLKEAIESFEKVAGLGGGTPELEHNLALARQLQERGKGDTGAVLLPSMEAQRERWVNRVSRLAAGESRDALEEPATAANERLRPLVSVVVAGSDDDTLLEESVVSVINQTYRPLEIVVAVRSKEAADLLAKRIHLESPLKVIEVAKDASTIDLMNHALPQAEGEYIAFLEPEQLYNIHHVQRMVDSLSVSEARAGYSDAIQRRHRENEDGSRAHSFGSEIIFSREFNASAHPPSDGIPISTIVIHRFCLQVVAFLDAELNELAGVDLLKRVSRHTNIHHLQEITVELREEDPTGERSLFVTDLDARHRKMLDNYSRFEPLELMRRVVELDNVNTYLRAELARAQGKR